MLDYLIARGDELGGSRAVIGATNAPADVAKLGPRASAATAAEAAAQSDVVVVAIPYGRLRELPAEQLRGKIVVDAGNYYPQRDGHIAELDSGHVASTAKLADHLGGARVVKAFNTIYYVNLRDEGRPDAPPEARIAVPVAADDAEAKQVVAGLIEQIGFAPVDGGSLRESVRQQPGAPISGNPVGPDEARKLIADTPPATG